MDLIEHPTAARIAPTGPRISDPWLRAQLPAAVRARPADEQVPAAAWRQVAACLEATGHAAACAQDGTDPSSVAVLASLALHETEAAAELVPPAPARSSRPTGARPAVVPVERTWFRLAGLLAGPVPGDPGLLAVVLDDHRAALLDWQRILLAPARLAARVSVRAG